MKLNPSAQVNAPDLKGPPGAASLFFAILSINSSFVKA
jgi:hypothetical protein